MAEVNVKSIDMNENLNLLNNGLSLVKEKSVNCPTESVSSINNEVTVSERSTCEINSNFMENPISPFHTKASSDKFDQNCLSASGNRKVSDVGLQMNCEQPVDDSFCSTSFGSEINRNIEKSPIFSPSVKRSLDFSEEKYFSCSEDKNFSNIGLQMNSELMLNKENDYSPEKSDSVIQNLKENDPNLSDLKGSPSSEHIISESDIVLTDMCMKEDPGMPSERDNDLKQKSDSFSPFKVNNETLVDIGLTDNSNDIHIDVEKNNCIIQNDFSDLKSDIVEPSDVCTVSDKLALEDLTMCHITNTPDDSLLNIEVKTPTSATILPDSNVTNDITVTSSDYEMTYQVDRDSPVKVESCNMGKNEVPEASDLSFASTNNHLLLKEVTASNKIILNEVKPVHLEMVESSSCKLPDVVNNSGSQQPLHQVYSNNLLFPNANDSLDICQSQKIENNDMKIPDVCDSSETCQPFSSTCENKNNACQSLNVQDLFGDFSTQEKSELFLKNEKPQILEDFDFKVPNSFPKVENEEFTDATKFFKDPSAMQFLENAGSAHVESDIPRSSLYLKFDPLHSKEKYQIQRQDQVLVQDMEALSPEKNHENLSLQQGVVNKVLDIAVRESLGTLISFDSPKKIPTNIEKTVSVEPQKLYTEDELQQKIKLHELALQEVFLKKQFEMESQLSSKSNENVEEVAKLQSVIKVLKAVFEECLFLLNETAAEKNKLKSDLQLLQADYKKSKEDLKTATEDLQSVENTFADFHKRYEQCKGMLKTYKENEACFQLEISELKKQVIEHEEKYQLLQEKAEEALDKKNAELVASAKTADIQLAVLRAQLKKSEMRVESHERDLDYLKKENDQLKQLYDDIVEKVGAT